MRDDLGSLALMLAGISEYVKRHRKDEGVVVQQLAAHLGQGAGIFFLEKLPLLEIAWGGQKTLLLVRDGEVDVQKALWASEMVWSELVNPTFCQGQRIRLAELPVEDQEAQQMNRSLLGCEYGLFVWRVEMVRPDTSGLIPVRHHQHIMVGRKVGPNQTEEIRTGNGWVSPSQTSQMPPSTFWSWWSGFWFEPE